MFPPGRPAARWNQRVGEDRRLKVELQLRGEAAITPADERKARGCCECEYVSRQPPRTKTAANKRRCRWSEIGAQRHSRRWSRPNSALQSARLNSTKDRSDKTL